MSTSVRGGGLGERQLAVHLGDEVAAERDEEEDAEDRAEERHEEDLEEARQVLDA